MFLNLCFIWGEDNFQILNRAPVAHRAAPSPQNGFKVGLWHQPLLIEWELTGILSSAWNFTSTHPLRDDYFLCLLFSQEGLCIA